MKSFLLFCCLPSFMNFYNRFFISLWFHFISCFLFWWWISHWISWICISFRRIIRVRGFLNNYFFSFFRFFNNFFFILGTDFFFFWTTITSSSLSDFIFTSLSESDSSIKISFLFIFFFSISFNTSWLSFTFFSNFALVFSNFLFKLIFQYFQIFFVVLFKIVLFVFLT